MTANCEQLQQWQAWARAADDAAVDAQLRGIYDALAQQIDRRSPTCWLSGNCCRFDSYGHRLYVTGLEVAWMMRQLDDAARARLAAAQLPGADGCAFQVDKLCSIRIGRGRSGVKGGTLSVSPRHQRGRPYCRTCLFKETCRALSSGRGGYHPRAIGRVRDIENPCGASAVIGSQDGITTGVRRVGNS